MRCGKCGYHGFDHSSECKKCRSDLREAREELGLLDIEPSIPGFLEALLGGGSNKAPHEPLYGPGVELPERREALDFAAAEIDIPDLPDDDVLIGFTDDAPWRSAPGHEPGELRFDSPNNWDTGPELQNGADADLSLDFTDDELDKLIRDIEMDSESEKDPEPDIVAADGDVPDFPNLDLDLESSGDDLASILRDVRYEADPTKKERS